MPANFSQEMIHCDTVQFRLTGSMHLELCVFAPDCFRFFEIKSYIVIQFPFGYQLFSLLYSVSLVSAYPCSQSCDWLGIMQRLVSAWFVNHKFFYLIISTTKLILPHYSALHGGHQPCMHFACSAKFGGGHCALC